MTSFLHKFLHTDATDLVGLVFAVFRELCPEDIARGLLCPRLLVKIFAVTGKCASASILKIQRR